MLDKKEIFLRHYDKKIYKKMSNEIKGEKGELLNLPEDLSFHRSKVCQGIISFECPIKYCKKKYTCQYSFLDEKAGELLTPTAGLIGTRPPIIGWLVAIAIGFSMASGVIILFGIPPSSGSILAAAIVLVLGKPLASKYSKPLPVSLFKCEKCGNGIPLASDGVNVLVGKQGFNFKDKVFK